MSRYAGTAFTLSMMTNGRTMPWLRCAPMSGTNDPSTTWAVPDGRGGTRPPLYRELVVLDHRNEVILSFDLASKPIDGAAHAAQRALVRDALRTAAALEDTDGDRLPDAWETDAFGRLDAVSADTPTASGLTAWLAYGLGHSPHAASDALGLRLTRAGTGFQLSYTRRLDRRPAMLWKFQRSQDLGIWIDWVDSGGETVVTRYDGTGTETVTHLLPADSSALSSFRLILSAGVDPPR